MASGIDAVIEGERTANWRRYVAVVERAYFFCDVSTISLDTHSVYHIISDLYFPRGRYFMTQEKRASESPACSRAKEQLMQLIVYIIVMLGSFAAFFLFVLLLKASYHLSNIWPEIGMICRIIAWPLTILGAICCIATALTSTIIYLKFLGIQRWFLWIWRLL